jgi:antibiotic biosynthesis monooxygenase (ABM) superfamily enzyme
MQERVTSTADSPEPITVVRIHYVKAGCEERFETELKKLMGVFSALPANLGISIFRPGKHNDGVYRVVYKFSSRDELDRWHDSAAYRAWLSTENELTIAPPGMNVLTGLETWFTLPGQHVVRPPKKHRQAIVTWIAVLPLSIIITILTNPFLETQSLLIQKIVFVSILVPVLTWLAMPALTQIFSRWLYELGDPAGQREEEPFH